MNSLKASPHEVMIMNNEAIDLAARMTNVLMSLPEDLKLKVYHSFIFQDDAEMIVGVDNSQYMPSDEMLASEVMDCFMRWDVRSVKRYVDHAEGIAVLLLMDIGDKLTVTTIKGNRYAMKTSPLNGSYLSIVVTCSPCAPFWFSPELNPIDYLLSPFNDVVFELIDE
mgnify:CR=1 FL=1|tara:strand:- start:5236 stop:5736 length:501 start_codon:yes stop_codon:yes gene_type:complete